MSGDGDLRANPAAGPSTPSSRAADDVDPIPEAGGRRSRGLLAPETRQRAIGLLAMGLGGGTVLVMASLLFGGDSDKRPPSPAVVAPAGQTYDPPGSGALPPARVQAEAAANQNGYTNAVATGKAHVARPSGVVEDLKLPEPTPPIKSEPVPVVPVVVAAPVSAPAQGDAAKAWQKVVGDQMAMLEQFRGFRPMQTGAVAAVNRGGMTDGAGTAVAAVPVGGGEAGWNGQATGAGGIESGGAVVVPAGHIAMGQLVVGADSDAPAAIVIDLVSRPLEGARLVGEFKSTDRHNVLTARRMSWQGREWTVSALALDPDTGSAGLVDDRDRHLFERVILPGMAEFLAGIGMAIGSAGTVVSAGPVSVVTQTPARTVRDQILVGAGRAGQSAGDVLREDARGIKSTIKTFAGRGVAVLFLESVREGGGQGR